MKKMIVTVAMLAGFSFANAQTSNAVTPDHKQAHERKHLTPDERASKDAAWAQKELGLNAEQTAKWQAASLEKNKANAALKDKFNGSTTPDERTQLRSQMKSNGEKFDASVATFLTEDQKTKFGQKKQERHSHKGRMHEGGKPGSNPSK